MIDILNTPLYFYEGCMFIWGVIYHLPWPDGNEYLRLTLAFVSLYPVRAAARYMEKRATKKLKRQDGENSHQSAVSSLDDLFHGH